MYKSYFELTSNPFDLTPDPAYFFSTRRHDEALAALHYGIRQHKGFVVVTGEVGTGKTLLLRCLLRLLKESKDVAYAYLFNSRLSTAEFLEYVLSEFELPTSGKNKAELLRDLAEFLISRGSRKLTTVLVIDEAHDLSDEVLEEVRLLSNLETFDDKLLQIVLVGQPELDAKLDSVGLRQLKQRIALRARLDSLDSEETRGYIEQRLRIAGAKSAPGLLFPEQTIAAVHRFSRGLPRLINAICENSLITAYARRLTGVTPEIVEEVANDLRLDVVRSFVAEKTANPVDMDVHQAANILLEHYVALRQPDADSAGSGVDATSIESGHEQYI